MKPNMSEFGVPQFTQIAGKEPRAGRKCRTYRVFEVRQRFGKGSEVRHLVQLVRPRTWSKSCRSGAGRTSGHAVPASS